MARASARNIRASSSTVHAVFQEERLKWIDAAPHHPHVRPWFCALSHSWSGAEYSSTAPAPRPGVDPPLPGERLQRVRPWLARSEGEHGLKTAAGLLAPGEATAVERA